MRKITTRTLAALLCLLTVISAFSVIPMYAEDTASTETSSSGNVLWSLDFDDYKSGNALTDYLSGKGINVTASDASKTFIGNGELYNDKQILYHSRYTGDNADNIFSDLFYGMYEDSDGNAVTSYYMDIDYTLKACNETTSKTITGTVENTTYTYTVYSPYRGESYFNPLADSAGKGFDKWFFKVSPTGYLYTADMAGTVTLSPTDKTNVSLFTYTKKVTSDGTTATEVSKAPLTETVWNEINTNCGTSWSQISFDKTCTLANKDKGYQLALGTEYTIRVAFSVDASSNVTATTYVKPANSDETFTKVGSCSYKYSSSSGNATTNNIRFSENVGTYSFDNIKFATYSKCESGEHEFPVVASNIENENGFESCELIKCLSCGAEWYNYFSMNEVQTFKFESFTEQDYNDFKSSDAFNSGSVGAGSFTLDGGIKFPQNSDLWINSPELSADNNYWLKIKVNFSSFPTAANGMSLLTDVVSGSNPHNMFLRLGKNSDGTGWLKLRTVNQGISWSSIQSVYTLSLNTDYEIAVLLKPSEQKFDLYIGEEYIATGGIASWENKYSSNSDKRVFRVSNQSAELTLKEYSITKIEDGQTYNLINGSQLDFTFDKDQDYPLQFTNNTAYGALATNCVSTNQSTTLYIKDNDFVLGRTPYTLSFDFMMTDKGEYKDSASTDAALWSLISWINNEGNGDKYGTMVRVGGLDNDSSSTGFEKFFIVMENNNGASVTADNGNQSYTQNNTTKYFSDHNAVYTFEAGEWVTFTLAVNPINNSAYLYADGELVGSAAIDAIKTAQLTAGTTVSKLRIGDDYRKLYYNWAIKDISVELTPENPVDVTASGTVFNMDFGKTYVINSSTTTNLGSVAYSGVSANTKNSDSASAEGYTSFLADAASYAAGNTKLFDVSLTSKIGTDKYYHHVDGGKYSVETAFALYDRALTDEEKGSFTDVPETLSEAGEVGVIGLSKHDGKQSLLVKHTAEGLVDSSDRQLYIKKNGEYTVASAWYTADDLVDGKIPDGKWIKIAVVADEANSTYSIYINGSVAYYKDGETYKRAADLGMSLDTATGLIENTDYISLFANAFDFSVQNVKVTKMENAINYVGSQIRTESETSNAFDVRFVFGVDDVYVDRIEYDVAVEIDHISEGAGETAVSDTVYTTIKSDSVDINAWKYEEGEYFSTFVVDGVELANADTSYTFRITPYVVRYDSTTNTAARDEESAKTTHVVEFNGLGEFVSYRTESSESNQIKSAYTAITSVPYKALGRTQVLDGVLTADWSAAGIEFNATCVGDVFVKMNLPGNAYFTVVVDGVEYKHVLFGNGNNIIAEGLEYGAHNFKIMNENGYPAKAEFCGVTVRGEFGAKPADNALLIEYIGDSITVGCGLGVESVSKVENKITGCTNDAMGAYAYLSANALGADYTIMANGGMGIKWGTDHSTTNVNRSMAQYPYLNQTNRSGVEYSGYNGRTAGLVVIGLNTNDGYQFMQMYNAKAAEADLTAEDLEAWKNDQLETLFKPEFEALIAEIEENHGANVPIVIARDMMKKDASASDAVLYQMVIDYLTKLVNEEWSGKYNGHTVMVASLTSDRNGYTSHPTAVAAEVQGADLAKFISDNREALGIADKINIIE